MKQLPDLQKWDKVLRISWPIHWYMWWNHYSPTCSFIRMRQISYSCFSRKTKRSYLDPLMYILLYRWSQWAWNKDTTDTARFASCLDLQLEVDSEGRLRMKPYHKRGDFNFPLWTVHLYVATFQQHLYMEYISLSWSDIPELVASIMMSYRGLMLWRKLLDLRFLLVKVKS